MDGRLNRLTHAFFGYGLTAKKEYGFGDRILGFFVMARPIFLILTPLNAASGAVLGLGGYPSLIQCLLGFCTAAFAGAAVNMFNDYVDRERDKLIWQARPIPSGRVKAHEALILIAILFAASLSMSWFLFNPLTFGILFLAVTLGCLYSAYLRDRVGYLSLPPIVGLIPLGGWAAFSPDTLFHSLLPWYLYFISFVWQAAHIMIHYPLDINRNINSQSKATVSPAFFFSPSARVAVGIGTVFTFLTLIMSILLPLLAPVGTLYLILVLAMGAYAFSNALVLLEDTLNREKGLKAFASLSVLRLTISAAILLTVFISQL